METREIKICCEYTELVPIEHIKPNPKNNNQHSPEQYKRLAKNMLNLGIRHPITISKLSGLIVFGHARYEAFKILGLKEVPVEYQDFKDEQEEYAAMTADNALQADWSDIDLAMVNLEIPNFSPDFDIELLGINNFTIDISEKINRGNENSEWVNMPEFKPGENDVKIIIYFNSEEDREAFRNKYNLNITRKQANQWIIKI